MKLMYFIQNSSLDPFLSGRILLDAENVLIGYSYTKLGDMCV